MSNNIKDGDFMSHKGKSVIVRKDFNGEKQQGKLCCEYTDEEGNQKLIWVDVRELGRYPRTA